jgi:hypothetical protein
MTLELRREWLWSGVVLAVLLALYGLGRAASPHLEPGRPALLLPDVRAVVAYRQKALAWQETWAAIDGDLNHLLSGKPASLLEQSRLAERLLERSVEVARAAESAAAPGSLIGLHDQALAAAGAYFQASAALNRWLSAPTAANKTQARAAHQAATAALAALRANEWLAPAPSLENYVP